MNIKLFEESASHLAGAVTPQFSLRTHDLSLRRAIRLAAAVGIIAVILALFLRFSYLGKTAIVLTLLLAVLGIATKWGLAESLAAAIAAGLLAEYFVIPPFRLGLAAPQHWIALSAFLITAITTSQLSIKARRKELEAKERERELENLYNFSQAILRGGSLDSMLASIVERIVEVFGVGAAGLYYCPSSQVFRAGSECDLISEDVLRGHSDLEKSAVGPGYRSLPLHLKGSPVGRLCLRGDNLSDTAVQAIAQRIDIAMERIVALEEAAKSEAARKSDELKSVVLDALAHDLKTPLASIKAAATCLLSDRIQASAADFELLCVINEETDRLNRLTNEAVEMARIEVGILELEKREYSIRETIYAALEDLNSTAAGRQIQMDIPETLPSADIDFRLVKQVFKQLLDNALKYSPEGSPVLVSSECSGDCIVVSVADSGPGIPDVEKPHIFEKYYRGSEGRQGSAGTGMGLAIAKNIVEKHGGQIWVANRPDRGAIFKVSLPVHETRFP